MIIEKDEFHRMLDDIVKKSIESVRLILREQDIRSINSESLSSATTQTFPNYDDSLLIAVSELLSKGNQIAIQAAGPDELLVLAAPNLFHKAGTEDKFQSLLGKLYQLSAKYLSSQGEPLFEPKMSYIKPVDQTALAKEFAFNKAASFPIDDHAVVDEIEKYLKKNLIVILAGYTQENRADVWVQPEQITQEKIRSTVGEQASQWEQAMGPNQFKACVEVDIQYPGKDRLFVDKHALGCLRCNAVTLLRACGNCGSTGRHFGVDSEGVVGLFCTRCRQGFISWKCNCGTVNPITYETILTKKLDKKAKSGGCFIATAVYDSAESSEVIILQEFRNEYLSKLWIGRVLVKLYYRVSPSIVRILEHGDIYKKIIRTVLVDPVVWGVRISKDYWKR